MGLDCGPKSIELFKNTINDAKTILWNGPPGVFEFDAFATGTKATLDAAVAAAQNGKMWVFSQSFFIFQIVPNRSKTLNDSDTGLLYNYPQTRNANSEI